MALPNMADLKTHLNIPASRTTDDAELQGMLDAAEDLVAALVGPLGPTPVTETHFGVWSTVLVLRQAPVVSLTTVASRVGAIATALTLSDYEVDPATGIVRLASGGQFYGNYTITYSAGRSTIPASIGLAILIIAAHLWETQRGTSPTALALQQSSIEDQPFTPGAGFAIPNRARELLAPYLLPPVIA